MKALKSQLAKEVLSDPKAKQQLRSYLANKGSARDETRSAATGQVIEVHSKNGTLRITPTVVPKAA